MSESLVIAPQWIGDAVMSEPLLAALAARGERVTVAALPWVAPVYRAMDSVAAIELLPFGHGRLDWSARRALGRQWWGRYTAAYVLPNSLKAALLPWLAGVPRRVGYLGESRYLLLNERLTWPLLAGGGLIILGVAISQFGPLMQKPRLASGARPASQRR